MALAFQRLAGMCDPLALLGGILIRLKEMGFIVTQTCV